MKFLDKVLQYTRSGRGIYRACQRVGLSIPVSRIVTKQVRLLSNLPTVSYRKLLGFTFRRSNPATTHFDPEAGCGEFNALEFSWGEKVIAKSERMWNDFKSKTQVKGNQDGKPYRADLLGRRDILEQHEFLLFACDAGLVSAVSAYLGTFPVLANIQLWHTGKNDYLQSAQRFHIDQEDFRQIKIFINVKEVKPDNGPLTVLKAQASKRILKKFENPYQRVPDKIISENSDMGDVIEFIGQAGSAGYADTARCFHMGSRTRSGSRLVLMLHYVAFPVIREAHSIFGNSPLPFNVLPSHAKNLFFRQ